MSIFRVVKDKENPYVMINKSAIQDEKLSWKAKGLLSYLLSMPDDWQVYETELVKHSKDGRESTRSTIKELITAGYIERSKDRIRDDKGLLKGYEYRIYETSIHVRKSYIGETYIGKPDNTNTDLINNDKSKYKNDNGALEKETMLYGQQEANYCINYYFTIYLNLFGKKHRRLKKEQWEVVRENLRLFIIDNGLDEDGIQGIVNQHFMRNINTDYNINHFATEGILQNLLYEVA